ncbi:MAG: RICIN domain-containing protein, partial [Zhenhengia sp.]
SLNDATQLTQSTYSGGDNEKWNLTKNPDNTYFIQNVLSNKCVDLTADSGVTSNGTSITQYTYHGDSNQRWYLVPTDNGYFRIISALSGKALCVKDASTADNAKIIQWTYENDDTNDEWIFITP